jgi:hypothetical protein
MLKGRLPRDRPALAVHHLDHLGLNALRVELLPAIDRIPQAGVFLLGAVPTDDPGRLHGCSKEAAAPAYFLIRTFSVSGL